MKFHLKKRKHFSTVRVVKHLKQLSKQQAALVDPALSREAVGLDDVQTPFSTPGIPWFLFKEETKGKQLHLSNMDYGLNVSCFLLLTSCLYLTALYGGKLFIRLRKSLIVQIQENKFFLSHIHFLMPKTLGLTKYENYLTWRLRQYICFHQSNKSLYCLLQCLFVSANIHHVNEFLLPPLQSVLK